MKAAKTWKALKPGDTFGRWTVVRYHKKSTWLCRCECGTEKPVFTTNLRRGISTSCGCYRSEFSVTHGMSHTREYKIWSGMMERCTNPLREGYQHYGGRGIRVCERWHKFENFYADMGPVPPQLTLDRENVNGNYEPGNCKWATWSEQRKNKRPARLVAIQALTIADLEIILAERKKEGVFG